MKKAQEKKIPLFPNHPGLMLVIHLFWISWVLALVDVLGSGLLLDQQVSLWIITKEFLAIALVLYTFIGSIMLVVWLFFKGILFLVAGILMCGLGVTVLILLGIFHAYNAHYLHIVIIAVILIALGVGVLLLGKKLSGGTFMGLFGFLKKKKEEPLSFEEQRFIQALMQLYEKLKARHHCLDGWTNSEIKDLSISLNGAQGIKDLSIQLMPMSPRIKKFDQPMDILFDVSLEGKKTWDEIKKLLLQQRQTITFFQAKFSFSDILCESFDEDGKLPRLAPHPAGVTGFWMYLPLPDREPFSPVEAYDPVMENCIRVAKLLAE